MKQYKDISESRINRMTKAKNEAKANMTLEEVRELATKYRIPCTEVMWFAYQAKLSEESK